MISCHADRVRFSDTVANYLNAKYQLGARGPHFYDCLTFVWHFYHDLGVDLPEFCGDWTAENYAERYQADPEAARAVLAEWLEGFGSVVPWEEMTDGDLVVCTQPDMVGALVCIGRGNLLCMDIKHGAMVVGSRGIDREKYIVEVRRWPLQ